jgi:molybdopterin-binding protein
MKISARNQLKGKIKSISEGSVNTEVAIELAPGIEIISIITKSSANSMGLEVGKEAYAVVKASNVIVGVDH